MDNANIKDHPLTLLLPVEEDAKTNRFITIYGDEFELVESGFKDNKNYWKFKSIKK